MKTRTENWRGYSIRFVEIDGTWWAVLKDICDALNLSTWKVAQRLEPNMLEKVSIEADLPSSPVTSKNGVRKSQTMLIVNEIGIYEALFASRRLEARKIPHMGRKRVATASSEHRSQTIRDHAYDRSRYSGSDQLYARRYLLRPGKRSAHVLGHGPGRRCRRTTIR